MKKSADYLKMLIARNPDVDPDTIMKALFPDGTDAADAEVEQDLLDEGLGNAEVIDFPTGGRNNG